MTEHFMGDGQLLFVATLMWPAAFWIVQASVGMWREDRRRYRR